jgi:hypothetical protein
LLNGLKAAVDAFSKKVTVFDVLKPTSELIAQIDGVTYTDAKQMDEHLL